MLSAGSTVCKRRFKNCFVHVFQSQSFVPSSSAVDTRKYLQLMQFHPTYSTNQLDDNTYSQMHRKGASSGSLAKSLACLPDEPFLSSRTSLAKSLACLPDETSMPVKRKDLKRMELKRSIETRIKKRVKEQYLNGKFCDLMKKVIANANTLQDSYDVIRLNSNVDLTTEGDGLCFGTLAEQLASGNFDVKSNTMPIFSKSKSRECLILPNVKLKVIQEAVRIVLEVVYRPHFSKTSHGCRSGRGHRSALRYICHEIHNPDWWFTLRMNKKADINILSKLLLEMEEKIIDTQLFSFIHCLFDANVLNLEFGGFPKGHGLPQEGILSPILMNIYLNILDQEVFRIFMRYEGLGMNSDSPKGGQHSKLRHWIRRQIKDNSGNENEQTAASDLRLHSCRCMDEIFIAVSGSKEIALRLKVEIENFLKNSLYLELEDRTGILAVGSSFHGLQFLGTAVRATSRASEAVRAVHKLKDKVKSFASQKQELWDALTVRIGKKWLAHGLKRIKESEIKQLGLSSPMLDQISHFRKEGMKTDHWFKSLIKIWLQDVNGKVEDNEQVVLSKYIAEPAVPKDLRDSFYKFQMLVEEYVSYETAATLVLLSNSSDAKGSTPSPVVTTIKMEAPISFIRKCLMRYGLINIEGFPRRISTLLLQDDILIVHWFSGLVCRWLKWYSEFDNFQEIKLMIVEQVRKSCIRTLAVKHQMHESVIEKRFELELNGIPLSEELEFDMSAMTSDPLFTNDDESLMYGIFHSGLCMLSLARVKVPSRHLNCFVVGCSCGSPSMYTLHVKERQRFPGWKTGFSTAIHPSLNGKRIALCKQHVKDLYLGNISLQSVDFCALRR